MSGARSISPMTAWLVALAMVLPMPIPLLVPLMIVEPAGIEGADEIHYRRELAEYLDTDRRIDGRAKGVMLAMSGGSCATVGASRLTESGVEMYVAYYYGATIATFEGLVDLLNDGRPDFIAIQDTVLVMKPTPYQARNLYYKARTHWYGQLYGLGAKLNFLAVDSDENDSWRCGGNFVPREAWPDIVVSASNSISTITDQKRSQIVEFLGKFDAAGIPVIIAGPPENRYTASYRQEVFQIVQDVVNANSTLSNVTLHRQSRHTPLEHFYDPLHVAPEANQPYRNWLNNEIIHALRNREDR